MIIVTLTSIPPRFGHLGQVIDSLLRQTVKIDGINLYLPRHYRRFPEHHFSLPQVPQGVRIITIDEDLGPASKILPAAREYRGTAAKLIYCDDDRIYERHWAQALIQSGLKRPNDCICNAGFKLNSLGLKEPTASLKPRAIRRGLRFDLSHQYRSASRRVRSWITRAPVEQLPKRRNIWRKGYVDIMEGYGGVLVKPEFFDDSAWNIPNKLWPVDDIWLSGHVAKKRIGIWLNGDDKSWVSSSAGPIEPLMKATINGLQRRDMNKACVGYMQKRNGVWT